MRTLTPIKYEWVKDLLPKLHDVDVHKLSTSGTVEGGGVSDEAGGSAVVAAGAGSDATTAAQAAGRGDADQRRTTDDAVSAARERYLERKRQRMSGQH